MFARKKAHLVSPNRSPAVAMVWRGEKNRTFKEVQQAGGFFPKGLNNSLKDHIEGHGFAAEHKRSAYLSFSKYAFIAMQYAGFGSANPGTAYFCNRAEITIDVTTIPNDFFPDGLHANYRKDDVEIAGWGALKLQDIYATIEPGEPGSASLQINPAYQFRNWCIHILSADSNEQHAIEKLLHDTNVLAEHERYFNLHEAREIQTQIKQQFKDIDHLPYPGMFFQHTPRKYSADEAINFALETCHKKMKNMLPARHLIP